MSLILSNALRRRIRSHGQNTYPHECCGFLLGRASGGDKQVTLVLEAANERDDSARNRYLISPPAIP